MEKDDQLADRRMPRSRYLRGLLPITAALVLVAATAVFPPRPMIWVFIYPLLALLLASSFISFRRARARRTHSDAGHTGHATLIWSALSLCIGGAAAIASVVVPPGYVTIHLALAGATGLAIGYSLSIRVALDVNGRTPLSSVRNVLLVPLAAAVWLAIALPWGLYAFGQAMTAAT